jgi:AraC family transcriptional regulator
LAPEAGKNFWLNERTQIKSVINGDVYIGMTFNIDTKARFSDYMPAVQIRNSKNIPQGLSKYTFEASLCAKFRYIGQHHYFELSSNIAMAMYEAIWKFEHAEQSKYKMLGDETHFERIDTSLYDGTYCQMEWYAPVIEKTRK